LRDSADRMKMPAGALLICLLADGWRGLEAAATEPAEVLGGAGSQ